MLFQIPYHDNISGYLILNKFGKKKTVYGETRFIADSVVNLLSEEILLVQYLYIFFSVESSIPRIIQIGLWEKNSI